MVAVPGMSETMAAHRLLGWRRPPETVEVPVPEVGPGDVLVEVAGCGLCHSDLAMVAMPAELGEALGWEIPFTLGHEVAGTVAARGREVTDVAEGDAVLLAAPSCGACAHCRAGRDSACTRADAGRGYGRDGGLARFILVDGTRSLVPLGTLDPRHAGPLSDAGGTSMHAVRRVRPVLGPGATVVVIGVGGLGSFAVQILRATTEARIVAVDIDPARRDVARSLGAHHVVDGSLPGLHRTLRGFAADGLEGVDAVIDIVGTDATITAGIASLRRGGAFALVGAGGGGYARPWFGGLPREATIIAIERSCVADARAVVDLAATGALQVDVEEYPLARVADAYRALDEGTLSGRAVVIPSSRPRL